MLARLGGLLARGCSATTTRGADRVGNNTSAARIPWAARDGGAATRPEGSLGGSVTLVQAVCGQQSAGESVTRAGRGAQPQARGCGAGGASHGGR